MVVMKDVIANFFLNLASLIKGEDRGLKIEDRANKPPSILNPPFSPQVEAMLTAHPVWGADEARATAAFLNSPAGQLFSKRIRSVAAHVAIQGANDRANTIHSAGVSAGWNECVQYIHSLSRVSGDQDTPQVGASNLKDKSPIEDESALLERLST
jgi:hypothetical protein